MIWLGVAWLISSLLAAVIVARFIFIGRGPDVDPQVFAKFIERHDKNET